MVVCYCVLVVTVCCLEPCSTSGDVCSHNEGEMVGLGGTSGKG